MKVYIAAPYPERSATIDLMRHLEAEGIEVTATWLLRNQGPNSDSWARQCIGDLRAADVLVALNPDGWGQSGTGGRHVEFGYALALGMPIVLVGARTNVFHCLSTLTVIDSVEWLVPTLKALPVSRTEAFHDHLDACPTCKDDPLQLCPVGTDLLMASVQEQGCPVEHVQ